MASNPLYTTQDEKRVEEVTENKYEFVGSFAHDCDNLVHASCYRRLVGKTQLFPGLENDYFRNRLTHSNEVERIAITVAKKLNYSHAYFSENCINLNILRFAADAHDLGHPPFGHIGERTLDKALRKLNSEKDKYNGYGHRFEGNAQTIRLLTKIEKKYIPDAVDSHIFVEKEGIINHVDKRIGLNPTYRNIAAVLKYDNEISDISEVKKVSKGYYKTEASLIEEVKKAVLQTDQNFERWKNKFKTIECSIMDVADDIAYTTFDIEDALKGRFINMLDFFNTSNKDVLVEVIEEYNNVLTKANTEGIYDPPLQLIELNDDNYQEAAIKFINILGKPFIDMGVEEVDILQQDGRVENDTFKLGKSKVVEITSTLYKISNRIARNGYWRTLISSKMVNYFISAVEVKVEEDCPPMSRAYLRAEEFQVMEALKKFVFIHLTKSPRLKIVDYRGGEIVKEIFDTLMANTDLLPKDYKRIIKNIVPEMIPRIICDYVSGMTDSYAVDFYARLTSENHHTIFKPF